MTLHAREYWKQRFAADREQLEKRRQEGLAFAQKPLDQIIAEIFPPFQVHWQGSGAFGNGDGIQ